jgi:hypothetical protein
LEASELRRDVVCGIDRHGDAAVGWSRGGRKLKQMLPQIKLIVLTMMQIPFWPLRRCGKEHPDIWIDVCCSGILRAIHVAIRGKNIRDP